ncbi:RNA ligase-domain-containing protein [Trametes gibbosa]|nr:RNA ligase-domain-containing protein [Trametes gibbosa]
MSSPLQSPSPPPVAASGERSTSSDELQEISSSLSLEDEDSALIDELQRISKQNPKLIRWTDHKAPADPQITIRSWKMNEFKYYDIPSPFPTLARGLFTQEKIGGGPGDAKVRIVARGYDKFFNIGEVPWTTWASLETHTAAPYTLTLKSNGCIIFIAALTRTQLLVTSKHSLGPAPSASGESHAQAGERWLRKHLERSGKTAEQLARTLWDEKWTAVAELCDDSFEEHVLPYGPERSGLHLHGLNSCTRRFRTQAQAVVDAFADEWGFVKTASTVLDSLPAVRAFSEEVGRTGRWNGEALEGFVVRTRVAAPPPMRGGGTPAGASPYPAGSSFFFKIKFDEPYMMYRDWREVTKTLLAKGPSPSNVPKSKLRRAETKVYVRWVCDEIRRDRSQFAEYTKGRGIIATRERFLKWLESGQGEHAQATAAEVPAEGPKADVDLKEGKVIIVPVAVPGVGKTTVAVALAHLFGFGHVQSDDVQAKKPAPVFLKNVSQALKKHRVVIADKNNHLRQHREQLRDVAATACAPPAHLLALDWSVLDLPPATVHRICGDRIVRRGDRHQSLVADAAGKAHEGVLWQFLKTAEELGDSEADVVVPMDVEESLEDALARAVDACVAYLGVQKPDPEKIGGALAAARAYEPARTGRKTKAAREGDAGEGKAKAKAPPKPRYFGILAEVDLESALAPALAAASDVPASAAARTFWDALVADGRVAKQPHVTVVHSKSLPAEEALWERCVALDAREHPPLLRFRLSDLVWNERIMAAVVADLAVAAADDPGEADGAAAAAFVAALPEEVRARLHVTVGTKGKNVAPVEARDLVAEWRRGGQRSGVWVLPLRDVWVKGRLKGLVS